MLGPVIRTPLLYWMSIHHQFTMGNTGTEVLNIDIYVHWHNYKFTRHSHTPQRRCSDSYWSFCPVMRLKIKFYLFGIATRPTEKLAAKIILFAFQTIFLLSNCHRTWSNQQSINDKSYTFVRWSLLYQIAMTHVHLILAVVVVLLLMIEALLYRLERVL
jgi:hypothetical protein